MIMRRMACVLALGIFMITAAGAQEFEDNETPATRWIIKAEGGFNLWLTELGAGDASNACYGFMGALHVYYAWELGYAGGPETAMSDTEIAVGAEVAYLPIFSGEYDTFGGSSSSTNQATLAYLPLALEARISIPSFYFAVGIGYAPFIGGIQRLSGTDTLSGVGFFFAKGEFGFQIELFDSFFIHAGAAFYVPFTQILTVQYGSFSISSDNPLDMPPIQLSGRLGITIEI